VARRGAHEQRGIPHLFAGSLGQAGGGSDKRAIADRGRRLGLRSKSKFESFHEQHRVMPPEP
jgi:hypothetical protein